MISTSYGDARCIIFPGDGPTVSTSTLLFDAPDGKLAILHADMGQMERVGDTFHYIEGYNVDFKERPHDQGVKSDLQAALKEPTRIGDLPVEEYLLFPAKIQTPRENILPEMLDEIIEKRREHRETHLPVDGIERLQHDNLILARFGFRLVPTSNNLPLRMSLYKDEGLLKEDLYFSSLPLVISDESGGASRFALVLEEGESGGYLLLQEKEIKSWDMNAHLYTTYPVFINGKLVNLLHEPSGLYSRFWVEINGERVYMLLHPLPQPVSIRFFGWQAKWVLETDGTLIVEGRLANLELGYGEIFDWTLIKGKPFFFFEKDGKYGLSYDGQELPLEYDEVLHENCCGNSLTARVNENMAWFFGLRNGDWYYVELGRYE